MKTMIALIATLACAQFAQARTCATLSTRHSYEAFSGSVVTIRDGQSVANMERLFDAAGEDMDNRVSSVQVAPNCSLTVYQYQNYNTNKNHGYYMGGYVHTLNGYYNKSAVYDMNGELDDTVSSLQCTCY